MIDLAWDNDVLIKLSIYEHALDLLTERREVHPEEAQVVLATAKWVCPKALQHRISRGDAHEDSLIYLNQVLAQLQEVEPSAEEIALATDLEEAALLADVALDGGESILAAICITRHCAFLTGDKRATVALQALLPADARLGSLRERVFCLEQAVMTLVARLTGPLVREAICKWPKTDRALKMAVGCSQPLSTFSDEGLKSYIDDLRRSAPEILGGGYELLA